MVSSRCIRRFAEWLLGGDAVKSISVCIVAHNEKDELEMCLEAVRWADEIVVVVAGEDEEVLDVCGKYTDRVFRVENKLNPNENKNCAFSEATGEWILSLDPDERVTEELREEIMRTLLKGDQLVSGYFVPRKNCYFGKWLRHGGSYPDRQLRLFERRKGSFPCEHIHERLSVRGDLGYLRNPLLHYTYRSIGQYFEKLDFKTEFEAGNLYRQGIRPGFARAFQLTLLVPFIRFFRRYVLKGGFLDGWTGFMACSLDWVSCLVRYEKLVELSRSRGEVDN